VYNHSKTNKTMQTKVIGKVIDYQALKNTLVGGPRYELVIETIDGDILRGNTRSNATIGYSCLNKMGSNFEWVYITKKNGSIEFFLQKNIN
jgi:hypothetical protein